MPERSLRIPSGDNELAGMLHLPAETGTFPLVILCHGLRATKSDLLMVTLARELAYAGYASLRFDYYDHGESKGNFAFTTLSKEIDDTKAVVQFVRTLHGIDPKRIALIGHSLGGSAACGAIAKGTEVSGLCTINTRAVLTEYIHSYCTPEQYLNWEKAGELMLLGQYPLRKLFLVDLHKHDMLADMAHVKCPVLICQGTDDRRTPLSSARQLFGAVQGDKQLAIIEEADHGVRDADKQKELVAVITAWLKRVLQ